MVIIDTIETTIPFTVQETEVQRGKVKRAKKRR